MAESSGVNKCLDNEGRGERAAASPGAGGGGQRLIHAEWHPPPPPSGPVPSPALPWPPLALQLPQEPLGVTCANVATVRCDGTPDCMAFPPPRSAHQGTGLILAWR